MNSRPDDPGVNKTGGRFWARARPRVNATIALLEAKRAGLLGKGHWSANIVSGVIVGVVALPLAMAFAIASGAKPEQGLYSAIVGGS